MFTVKTIAAAAAVVLAGSAANASTISVSTFSQGAFDGYHSGAIVGYEDFEGFAAPAEYIGGVSSTEVGVFTTLGTIGSGTSVIGTGADLAIDNNTSFGRANTTVGGENWLASNDTDGISWAVAAAGGSLFNSVAFSLTDAADTGATLTVAADGETVVFDNLPNGNSSWVVIDFASFISSATVTLTNTGAANDGFGIDDVSIAAVPLPAGAALLLTGLGGLAAARRRKAAK